MSSRKLVFSQTLRLLIGQTICVAVMLGVYALLGEFNDAVLWGGVVGLVLATLNFFFMAVGTTLAADKAEKQDVKGGKALLQMSMTLRYVLLIILIFAFRKSGLCELLPMIFPLAFIRPILTLGEFFRKKGDEGT